MACAAKSLLAAEADELLDLEYLAHGHGASLDDDVSSGMVIDHPSVSRLLMSVDEKLYQPADDSFEGTAYENLSLNDIEDDTDAGFDRWDY
jgi:hypothetical protein